MGCGCGQKTVKKQPPIQKPAQNNGVVTRTPNKKVVVVRRKG